MTNCCNRLALIDEVPNYFKNFLILSQEFRCPSPRHPEAIVILEVHIIELQSEFQVVALL